MEAAQRACRADEATRTAARAAAAFRASGSLFAESIVQPAWVFLENVPGLVSDGYILQVLDDLRQADYQALPPLKWSVSALGADHKRARYWIAVYANGPQPRRWEQPKRRTPRRDADPYRDGPQGDAVEGRPWWAAESRPDGVAHGLPDFMDRHRAIANGQIPPVAVAAWRLLMAEAGAA